MPSWPGTLPQFVFVQGFEESLADVAQRTSMDAGPAKTRRRFTSGVRSFRVTIPMTTAEVAIFEDFFDDDLAGGTLSFDWVHPRTQAAATLRIVTPPPPRIVPEPGATTWTVSFPFEILP